MIPASWAAAVAGLMLAIGLMGVLTRRSALCEATGSASRSSAATKSASAADHACRNASSSARISASPASIRSTAARSS